MKKSPIKKLLCLGAALGCMATGSAMADPYYASPSSSSAGNWAGPYVGGFVGGTWSNFRGNPGTPGPSGTDSSFMGGGDIGNNWQFDHMIVGLEGDFSKFDNSSRSGVSKFSEDWGTSLRGRLGYSFGQFLPYVTAGVAGTETDARVSGAGTAAKLQPGPTAGGGVDAMLGDNWFMRAEYLYTEVPKDTYNVGGTTVAGGSDNNAVRVGLNYRF